MRTKQKWWTLMLFIALCATLFTGCGGDSLPPSPSASASSTNTPISTASDPGRTTEPTPKPEPTKVEPDGMAALIADFTCGSEEPRVQSYEYGYVGELTPEALSEGLSALTGLDFFIAATRTQTGILVTWKNGSTLVAGLDGRDQKEEFFFFDADSLRWFMMDSLYKTLLENFPNEDVFYVAEGGGELTFDSLEFTNIFPVGIPYMGSAFYAAHEGGRGFLLNIGDAADYLLEQLKAAGDSQGMALLEEGDAGDPWFGDMEVWYFAWGKNTPEKFTAERRFAVTYDWEIWEYDVFEDEWQLWN